MAPELSLVSEKSSPGNGAMTSASFHWPLVQNPVSLLTRALMSCVRLSSPRPVNDGVGDGLRRLVARLYGQKHLGGPPLFHQVRCTRWLKDQDGPELPSMNRLYEGTLVPLTLARELGELERLDVDLASVQGKQARVLVGDNRLLFGVNDLLQARHLIPLRNDVALDACVEELRGLDHDHHLRRQRKKHCGTHAEMPHVPGQQRSGSQ